jgi:very-long-chain (3R)-3-hydroxyacyl-CoA dehydratase
MDAQDVSAKQNKRPLRPLQSTTPKTQYLILYNFISCILWLTVLGRVLILIPMVGFGRVYTGVGHFAKYTQTLAVLEIVHALLGKEHALMERTQHENDG